MRIGFLAKRISVSNNVDNKDTVLRAVKYEDWRIDKDSSHYANGEMCVDLSSNDSKCWISHIPVRELRCIYK